MALSTGRAELRREPSVKAGRVRTVKTGRTIGGLRLALGDEAFERELRALLGVRSAMTDQHVAEGCDLADTTTDAGVVEETRRRAVAAPQEE